ncbi:MAG: twin-arginine translocase TatA/TatE family subunit [Bacteroidales bacterium]|nr:twin-arginine translocase TatA/TatE family subunit [Bacteroidales bacterium]
MIKPNLLLFLDFGGGEIIIILMVILIVLGPDKIPAFAKKAGDVIRFVRKATDDIKTEINKEANAVQEPFKEAYGEVSAFSRNASDAVKATLDDIENADKPTKTETKKPDMVSLDDIDKAEDLKKNETVKDKT